MFSIAVSYLNNAAFMSWLKFPSYTRWKDLGNFLFLPLAKFCKVMMGNRFQRTATVVSL